MYWTDRPVDELHDPPVAISWADAMQRLGAMKHDETRVVFAADAALGAYDMMREVQVIAAMGIDVVMYAFELPNKEEARR